MVGYEIIGKMLDYALAKLQSDDAVSLPALRGFLRAASIAARGGPDAGVFVVSAADMYEVAHVHGRQGYWYRRRGRCRAFAGVPVAEAAVRTCERVTRRVSHKMTGCVRAREAVQLTAEFFCGAGGKAAGLPMSGGLSF